MERRPETNSTEPSFQAKIDLDELVCMFPPVYLLNSVLRGVLNLGAKKSQEPVWTKTGIALVKRGEGHAQSSSLPLPGLSHPPAQSVTSRLPSPTGRGREEDDKVRPRTHGGMERPADRDLRCPRQTGSFLTSTKGAKVTDEALGSTDLALGVQQFYYFRALCRG